MQLNNLVNEVSARYKIESKEHSSRKQRAMIKENLTDGRTVDKA